MKKVLFIDRDGTLVIEPPDFQVDSLEKLVFYPGVFRFLSRIAAELDYELVMVSNQDGLGTPSFPEETFWPVQRKILTTLENEGIIFNEILIDRSFPEDGSPGRKPGTAMLTHYLKGPYNIAESYVIGDRLTDIQLAQNLGCKAIYLGEKQQETAALSTPSWADIYAYLKQQPRCAKVKRRTSETDILVRLNLDGSGKSAIGTGLGFLDHMLAQIARHGGFDLEVQAKGDLQVDEHHTMEDVAIVLGSAFREALGSKKGIERYAFLLPMDDCLAQVALDLGGRSWLVWDAHFRREKIGDVPTEMFSHFFRSFCDHAACNLNIKAEGDNEHHKIESIFKAFARVLQAAIHRNDSYLIPSTKGSL
ncbi:bifunctional histidinol-phosphatase/imidazoleglycerol-phosphate dehydratase HisB [Taibaiella koreensis]|uniref:bifunctional histidinol-phosphatase/imidazoleglycerol-phosphate dehydratase HisB n=1 Tax=Taibaiella koreensis TaxID=1268548 RepID=UPI000E59DA13|nr:bifunctional histidinol-phosphatase/imidazoleglycerol-phosphate dehydratase HisB [Taibaiella koreensis]